MGPPLQIWTGCLDQDSIREVAVGEETEEEMVLCLLLDEEKNIFFFLF